MLNATAQRCRVSVPLARNALAHVGKSGRRVVWALMVTAFAQDDAAAAKAQWRSRRSAPAEAAEARRSDDRAEDDVPAYTSFPAAHRVKLHSVNPIERLNEIKRRIEVVGVFPHEAAVTRLVGAILLEQSDE